MNYYLKVLQNYATFTGRARRNEFWFFILFNTIFSLFIGVIGGLMRTTILNDLYNIAVLIPGIAVGVRRMHDVGKSGWFLLVPIYNLVLACTEGTNGDNEYGPDPKGYNNEDSNIINKENNVKSIFNTNEQLNIENLVANDFSILANRKFQNVNAIGSKITWSFNDDGTKVQVKGGFLGINTINSTINLECIGKGKFKGQNGFFSQVFTIDGNIINVGGQKFIEIYN